MRSLSRLILLACCLSGAAHAANAAAATWLRTPAISPNGNRIAFRHRGDLWVVPAQGGEATLLAGGPHHESQPVWSPDSKQIAFASDRSGNLDIYLIASQGGEPRRLTFHSSDDLPSAFSPDGEHVIFSSVRHDASVPLRYPHDSLPGTFRVAVSGGATQGVLGAAAEQAQPSPDGRRWLFAERKGREMPWRKHEQSPTNWDLWLSDASTGAMQRLNERGAEHREPLWAPGGREMLFLSERSGSFNVWRSAIEPGADAVQVTHHAVHPVRSLSVSASGELCYGFDGGIYVLASGATAPKQVQVSIPSVAHEESDERKDLVTHFAVSPSDGSLAYVVRGELFMATASGRSARRLTHTPALEADPSFSPDGRFLAFASERDGHWQIYSLDLERGATAQPRRLIESTEPSWLPRFSPDGHMLAFVGNGGLGVLELASGRQRTLLTNESEFFRTNGSGYDIQWHPQGRWLAFPFADAQRDRDRVGYISVDGGAVHTVSLNAYKNERPRWSPDGSWLAWISDAHGLRDYTGDHGAKHVFAAPLTPAAISSLRELQATKEQVRSRRAQPRAEVADGPLESPGAHGDGEFSTVRIVPGEAPPETLAHVIEADGDGVVWASRSPAGLEFWRKSAGHPIERLGSVEGEELEQLELAADGRSVIVLVDGGLHAVSLRSGRTTRLVEPQSVKTDGAAERVAMLAHVGRYAERVFYRSAFEIQKWRDLVAHHQRFAPDAVTRRELTELLSELIGELNASHTEVYEWPYDPPVPEETATLGAVLEPASGGKGLRVAHIAPGSPLDAPPGRVRTGSILLAIDGHAVSATTPDWHQWLNDKAGETITLDFADPESAGHWQQRVLPLSQDESFDRFYRAWVIERRERVRALSDGKIAYSHLQGMDDSSFRRFYNDVMSASSASALIVDTRYNYGGWLHETLLPFLEGQFWFTLNSREAQRSTHPMHAWVKPSVLLANSANYSNGYEIPSLYQSLGIGKVVGAPVAGTGIGGAETRLATGLAVSIANDLTRDANGRALEGARLEPDVLVEETPEHRAAGRDPQLEKAVEILLASQHAAQGPAHQRAERIFAEFDGADRPGCAVSIMRDGQLIHSFARGMADLEARKPLDPHTVFNIASVSKQFTAFGLLLLEARGALSRDDPVTKYVPELGDQARGVTLRHLLHHTSGLRAYDSVLTLEGHALTSRTTREQAVEVLRRQRAPNAPPGVEYDYSNTGYFLLGLVIERVSGKTLREFMHEQVFHPLGMTSTEVVDRYPAGIERLARGYSPNDSGFDVDESLWEQTGDGQVHTTVRDLARWERNFLTGEVGGHALIAKLLETTQLVSGKALAYASGVVIGEYRGLPTVRHGGDWVGYRAHYARFPSQRFAVAVLCNRSEVVASRYALAVAEVYLAEHMLPVDLDAKVKELRTLVARGSPVRMPPGVYRNRETRTFLELRFERGLPLLRSGEDASSLREVEPGIFSLGESSGSYVAFVPGGSPRIVLQDSPQERVYELVRSAPATSLAAYAGTYSSPEVQARFEIAIRGGQLVLESGQAVLPLRQVAPGEFAGTGLLWEGEPFTLSFAAQLRGGFLLFTNGLRGVPFGRAP